MQRIKRKFRAVVHLLILDKKYWSKLHSFIAWKVRVLYNHILDYVYAGEFLGKIHYSEKQKTNGAHPTESTDYLGLFSAWRKVAITDSDVIVDVGCGKGRTILWLLKHHKGNKIYGIEVENEIADQTIKRFERYSNVRIIKGDAINNIPRDGNIFYLYNPFIEPIVRNFKEKLEELFYLNKNSITVIYHNPWYLRVFLNDPKWTVNFHHLKPKIFSKLLLIHQDTAIIKLNI